MKKWLKSVSAAALCAAVLAPASAFAATDGTEPRLVSEELVYLTSSGAADNVTKYKENGKVLSTEKQKKGFVLKTYEDNGVTVYGFDVEDQAYRQAAAEYIKQLTGDPQSSRGPLSQSKDSIQPYGPLLPGQSEYHNDTKYDGPAMSYAWKRNTANNGNNFEGGQSASWTGGSNAKQIVLNQTISISGLNVNITWPPGITGSGKTGTWQSQPITGNIAGSSFNGMKISGSFSATFTENGDVYVNSSVYRPMTYIKFSYFS